MAVFWLAWVVLERLESHPSMAVFWSAWVVLERLEAHPSMAVFLIGRVMLGSLEALPSMAVFQPARPCAVVISVKSTVKVLLSFLKSPFHALEEFIVGFGQLEFVD